MAKTSPNGQELLAWEHRHISRKPWMYGTVGMSQKYIGCVLWYRCPRASKSGVDLNRLGGAQLMHA